MTPVIKDRSSSSSFSMTSMISKFLVRCHLFYNLDNYQWNKAHTKDNVWRVSAKLQATSTGPRAMLSQRSVSLNNACFPAVYISSIIEMGDPPHLPDRPLQRKIGVIIDTGLH
jgi:hypothetical protein